MEGMRRDVINAFEKESAMPTGFTGVGALGGQYFFDDRLCFAYWVAYCVVKRNGKVFRFK